MARCLTALRSQVESALAGRFPSPFTFSDSNIVETVSPGIPEADGLTGGLPQGGITEICGPSCSGRTSLLMSALASRTGAAEACAFIDGRNAFDPYSAEATGVQLRQLMWVRCRNIDQALARYGFDSARRRLRLGGLGSGRHSAGSRPSCSAQCVVPVSSSGGAYAGEISLARAGAAGQDLRFAGSADGNGRGALGESNSE